MNAIVTATTQAVVTVATKYPTATVAATHTAAAAGGWVAAGTVKKVQARRARRSAIKFAQQFQE